MSSSDSLFYTLPKHLQRAIDDAFDIAINPNSSSLGRPSKRRKIDTRPVAGGGFLIEDPIELGGGGFIAEEDLSDVPEANLQEKPIQISLDLIPSALQHLDLPPDDSEVLSVFRNAASGWASSSIRAPSTESPQENYVSRDDWRSVCSVLVEHRGEEGGMDGDPNDPDSTHVDEDESEGESEEYVEEENGSDLEPLSDTSYDEFMEDRPASTSRRRTRTTKGQSRRPLSPANLSAQSKKLSSRQLQTCLDAFALFFPDVPHSELQAQRIMIKDLQRVSKLLNEKLKAEEVMEMLNMFSTSPDKSMNFKDFSRMMVAAKLA